MTVYVLLAVGTNPFNCVKFVTVPVGLTKSVSFKAEAMGMNSVTVVGLIFVKIFSFLLIE